MYPSLTDRAAIVTGASRGIGAAIARELAASGVRVMLNSRRAEDLEATAASIDGDVAWFAGNAGDPEVAEACVRATIDRFGRLDILVNNAATNPYYGPTVGVDLSRFDKTVQVNLRGPLAWSQAAWTQAMSTTPGVIVNVASVGALRTEANLGVYNVTKAALAHLTRQLACELGPTRVVGVAPGLVETDFSAVLVETYGTELAAGLPLQRLGQPEDVGRLVTFLASDHASWITGDIVIIDGGATVKSIA